MVSQAESNAAFHAARRQIDATGYGHWVNDDLVKRVVADALKAAEAARIKAVPTKQG